MSGSGMRLGKLINFALMTLLLFAAINWHFAAELGLQQNGKAMEFIDAVYFATVTTTTVGFGDITPTTPAGRIVVSIEALVGFGLFALVASTLYRKFSS
jgi:voltage-gated potassium channel